MHRPPVHRALAGEVLVHVLPRQALLQYLPARVRQQHHREEAEEQIHLRPPQPGYCWVHRLGDQRVAQELDQARGGGSDARDTAERLESERLRGKGEESGEDELATNGKQHEQHDVRSGARHQKKESVHHRQESHSHECHVGAVEDIPGEPRGRAEHHGEEPEGQDDAERVRELGGQRGVWVRGVLPHDSHLPPRVRTRHPRPSA
mmetsp:Transcript_5841/g.19898  ORF Transcript_5841/g.19898 Transcript_5841/m.19898 type:complete len:205 (-) Transcript_5841:2-616(-)